MTFITILAYIFGTLSGLGILVNALAYHTSTPMERALDEARGSYFPFIRYWSVFLISLAWIISTFIK